MDEKLKAAVEPILRGDIQIPGHFEIKHAVRSDKQAIQRARDSQTLTAGDYACLGVLSIPFLPPLLMCLPFLCCGIPCQVRNTFALFRDMLDDAENDVYVIGTKGGLVTVNMSSRTIKCWSPPTEQMMLFPDYNSFLKSVTTPCGSSQIRQPVLWVQKSPTSGAMHSYSRSCFDSDDVAKHKAGIKKDVWFVNEQELTILPTMVPNSLMGGGAGAMQGMMAQMMSGSNPQAMAMTHHQQQQV
jgi:hypothetical protein